MTEGFRLVSAGTVDGDLGAWPERNSRWGSRDAWFVTVGGLPIFDEPGR